jgi:hypothetical protein
MKRYGLPVFVALLASLLAPQAQAAEVHVNINIGAPPPIIVHSAPTMLYLPQPGFYVAVGIPYDLFFVGSRYYYVRGNDWYWGPGYGGPWTHVAYRSLPPGLQKYRVQRIREFREYEYRTYRVSRSDNRSKHFVADYGPGKGKGQGNGRGRGRR